MRALATAITLVLLAACAPQPPSPPPAAPPSRPPVPTSAPPAATPPPPPAQAAPGQVATPQPYAKPRSPMEAYKQALALQVLERNAGHTFEGVPPHLLRAVMVLHFTVDAQGRITSARVFRSPASQKALEPVALASLHRAVPFPPPPRALMTGNALELYETWLFRHDGKFQLRSIAAPQETLNPNEKIKR